jgi:hypothetical protein
MLVTITNVSSPAQQVHIPSLGFKWLESGDSVEVQRSYSDLDGDTSLKQAIADGLISLAFEAESIDSVQVFFGRVPLSFSDTTRGSAADVPVLSYIWNTDDNALNWSDGTVWRDATGAVT